MTPNLTSVCTFIDYRQSQTHIRARFDNTRSGRNAETQRLQAWYVELRLISRYSPLKTTF